MYSTFRSRLGGRPRGREKSPPMRQRRLLRTAKGITVRCTLSPTGRGRGEGCENPPVIPFAVLRVRLESHPTMRNHRPSVETRTGMQPSRAPSQIMRRPDRESRRPAEDHAVAGRHPASQSVCCDPLRGPRDRTWISSTSKPASCRRWAKARLGLADHTANTPAGRRVVKAASSPAHE